MHATIPEEATIAKLWYIISLNYIGLYTPDSLKNSVGLKPKTILNTKTQKRKKKMSAYDNGIAYSDSICCDIIRRVSDRKSIVIYASDHGDECYDWRQSEGRILGCALPGYLKTVYQVPAWIYVSDSFIQSYPGKVDMLRRNRHRPIYNSDLPHTLLDLAGVKTASLRPERSLLRDYTRRTSHRTIIIQNQPPYDYDAHKKQIDNTILYYQEKN